MWIIGCDYHARFQQIAFVNQATGECGCKRLEHANKEAEQFYRSLAGRQVRVGIESTGGTRWLEGLWAELGFELWIGDAARIRAAAAHKQKTDKRDAELLLQLMLENRFARIWRPTPEQRDLRQLLVHRHRLVQMRTRVKNQLQAIAMNEGLQRKQRLWSEAGQAEFRSLTLPRWSDLRRSDLLVLLKDLDARILPLDRSLKQQAEQHPAVWLLMTHPGVGPVVAMAYALTLGDPERFASSKQVASYLGLVPLERSSGGRQRLGHITKQGSSLLRGLLVEGARVAARHEPEWKRKYVRLAMKKNRIGCSSSFGASPGGELVVDVEVGTRLRAHERVPFARRVARIARWGAVSPRRTDWAPCLLHGEGVRTENHGPAVRDRIDG